MPEARPVPADDPPLPLAGDSDDQNWPVLRVRVPAQWKAWLDQVAAARALPTAALVRQMIRNFMLERHRDNGGN